jgi:hypothetical protein
MCRDAPEWSVSGTRLAPLRPLSPDQTPHTAPDICRFSVGVSKQWDFTLKFYLQLRTRTTRDESVQNLQNGAPTHCFPLFQDSRTTQYSCCETVHASATLRKILEAQQQLALPVPARHKAKW